MLISSLIACDKKRTACGYPQQKASISSAPVATSFQLVESADRDACGCGKVGVYGTIGTTAQDAKGKPPTLAGSFSGGLVEFGLFRAARFRYYPTAS
jgi:hypothetical protein